MNLPRYLLGFYAGFLLVAPVAFASGPNPDPHGPYWDPCAHRTCLGTACVGSRSGRTVCSPPPGSADPGAYRHSPPRL